MLTLCDEQVECLWDEVLPIKARELPEDLARLDAALSDPLLLQPIAAAWEQTARGRGRPSISMASFARLMVVQQRTGKPTEFGYVAQICEVTENTQKGARGFILPAGHAPGNASENRLLAHTANELETRRHPPAGARLRWRLPGRPDKRDLPRAHRRADPALRPPRARITQNPQAKDALPHRHRGPHQPPQARLRTTPHPAEGR
jgi:hypothetical protein